MGPSTSVEPYLLPSAQGVDITSVLTVLDPVMPSVNGYRMVGIPDGLGAFRTGGNEFTLLMNHELNTTQGAVRAHGSKGAFVSKWRIDAKSLKVLDGEDLIRRINLWNGSAYVQGTTAFNRFCSADLPDEKALRHGNGGTKEVIYLNGEESDDGRAWGHVVTGPYAGTSWELPRLGRLPFENVLVSPNGKDKTIVMCMEDGDLDTSAASARPCELYVYIGTKQQDGTPVEQAGLTNGKLYSAKVTVNNAPVAGETDAFGLGTGAYAGAGQFTLVEMGIGGNVETWSSAQLTADAKAKNATRFRRIEDGAWDPRGGRDNDFYFVTTADMNTRTRLWRLRFNNLDNPQLGGTLEILVNGFDSGQDVRMFDNITIDGFGRIILCEDVGNNPRIGKVWLYSIDSGRLMEIAAHNPKFFGDPTSPTFHTQDEESSGVIDAQATLGQGWFLIDVQDHRAISATEDPALELVQRGQLLAMYVAPNVGR
jgi:secreted PhoX family phosphatase